MNFLNGRNESALENSDVITEKKKGGITIKTGKRTRPYAYTFRVSEREKKMIDEKLKASGKTMTDFMVRAITEKPIVQIDSGTEILPELKRQGNNLNQAVKNNYFGKATERELLSCVDLCKKTYREILAAIGGS